MIPPIVAPLAVTAFFSRAKVADGVAGAEITVGVSVTAPGAPGSAASPALIATLNVGVPFANAGAEARSMLLQADPRTG